MSRLLINGCSYVTEWTYTCDQLATKMGFDEAVCIGQSGSSNSRIFRSTLEYILNNSVDFVILSLTFWDRQEAPWCSSNQWTDYDIHGVLRTSDQLQFPKEFYSNYIKSRYKYDVGPAYIDKFISDVIVFSGWLDSIGMRYLIFSAPNEHLNFDPVKLAVLDKNPKIINFAKWSSNQYLYDNGGTSNESGNPGHLHYDAESYKILNNFLYNYIVEHQI